MKQNRIIRAALLSLLTGAVAGCASETLHQTNHVRLTNAANDIAAGENQRALLWLDQLITETGSDPSTYALQRYFAAYLGTQAHLSAWTRPFLKDSLQGQGTGLDLTGTVDASATVLSDREAPVSHLVAMIYYAGYGLDWAPGLEGAEMQLDGQPLLPDELQALGVVNSRINLTMCQLAVFARLEFEGRVDSMLRQPGMAPLLEVPACTELMERANVRASVRPLVYYAIYEFLAAQDKNAIVAYQFGVKAIQSIPSTETIGDFGRRKFDTFESWVSGHEVFEWRCPKDDEASRPTETRCIACDQTETIDFVARRKGVQ